MRNADLIQDTKMTHSFVPYPGLAEAAEIRVLEAVSGLVLTDPVRV